MWIELHTEAQSYSKNLQNENLCNERDSGTVVVHIKNDSVTEYTE